MFSLLKQRTLSRLGSASLNVGRIHVVTTKPSVTVLSTLETRRTFLTGTPCLSFAAATADKKTPAKKTAAAKKPATKKKPAAKKPAATKTTAKAKPSPKPKKVVAKKRKVAAKPKAPTRPKLTKADMPPPRSYNAYLIFFTKYIKGLTGEHKPKSLKEISALAKDASSTWKNFTEAEKQPFKDEAVVARAKYVIERENYFAKVSQSTLNEINKRRKTKGKHLVRVHKPAADKRPASAFLVYLKEFRASSAGADIISSLPDNARAATVEIAKQGGKNWRAMSVSEKEPYLKQCSEAMAKFKADHA